MPDTDIDFMTTKTGDSFKDQLESKLKKNREQARIEKQKEEDAEQKRLNDIWTKHVKRAIDMFAADTDAVKEYILSENNSSSLIDKINIFSIEEKDDRYNPHANDKYLKIRAREIGNGSAYTIPVVWSRESDKEQMYQKLFLKANNYLTDMYKDVDIGPYVPKYNLISSTNYLYCGATNGYKIEMIALK